MEMPACAMIENTEVELLIGSDGNHKPEGNPQKHQAVSVTKTDFTRLNEEKLLPLFTRKQLFRIGRSLLKDQTHLRLIGIFFHNETGVSVLIED